MRIALISEEGQFYKVSLHCHTTISDGKLTPEEVKRAFKSTGYHAVCFTDHEILIGHKDLCDDEFIALHGYEVAIKKDIYNSTGLFMPVYHFNFIAENQENLKMPRFHNNPNRSYPGNSKEWTEKEGIFDESDAISETVYDKEWISDYLTAIQSSGFLTVYNHPQWSLHTGYDYLGLRGLSAIEIINGGCISMNDNTSIPFSQMLRSGMDVLPFAGEDNHGAGVHGGRTWTMVKAKALTYDALIGALKKGDCYASEGPAIESIVYEDGELIVKTSPAFSITLFSEGRYTPVKSSSANDLTEAHFAYAPEKFGRFFRFEVRDAKGRKAFSRAFFTKDLEI